jgi:4-aminobutyrate aminotransferase
MVFFGNSGAEAIEAAVKLARYYTGRQQFIAFLHGFHGRTLGSLSFTASKAIQREGFFPLIPGVSHVPYPDPYHPILNETGFANQAEAVLHYIECEIFQTKVPANEVAAILVETIQGEGGYVVPQDNFLCGLRELCDRYDILLIVDEIQSGMGRTGKWWGINHWNVEPDIVAVAKGIASGMPLGAIIARRDIMTDWGPGAHASTFGGNPISCAAGIATFDLLKNGLIDNAACMGDYMISRLFEIQDRHPAIGQVRGKGLMVGVELVKDRETRERSPDMRNAIVNYAFEEGLLILGCGTNTIRIIPPLTVTAQEIDAALLIFEHCVARAEEMYL